MFQNIFKILDHPYEDQNEANEIYRICFYVLGREALNLIRRDKIVPSLNIPHVRSIVLRLEHGAINSTWEVSNKKFE